MKEQLIPIRLGAVFSKLLDSNVADGSLLLTEEQNMMLITERIFLKAYNKVVWQYRNEYSGIYPKLNELGNSAIESVATAEGVERIMKLIVNEPTTREFVTRVHTSFKLQLALSVELYKKIIARLSESIVPLKYVNDGECMMPEEITDRMYTREQFIALLDKNPLLTTAIFITLWSLIYTPDELLYMSKEERIG